MRIGEDDRKTAAIIRDVAMDLFAARGAAGVTVREVARGAGVSPGLVMHHFGSKEGLKDAVDRRAARFVDEMLGELVRVGDEGGGASLAGLLADRLDREPALTSYLRRLLVDGGPAADDLFDRLFDTTLSGMRSLVAAGVARPAADEQVRAAFLLANDLAVVMLRSQIERLIGADPLGKEGLARWTPQVVDVYTNGVFVTPAPAPGTKSAGRSEQRRR